MKIIKFLGTGSGLWILSTLLILIIIGLYPLLKRSGRHKYTGRILIPVGLIETGIFFGILALDFPVREQDPVGAAVVPALWIYGILILGTYLLIRALRGGESEDPPTGRVGVVAVFIAMTVLYVILMQFIGYTISTLIYLISTMYYLHYREWKVMLSVTIGWILFSYFAFYRLLYVPLPRGILIERMFG